VWHILRIDDITGDEKEFVSKIQGKIGEYFPTHEYIYHKLLMDVKIEGGILHNDEDQFKFDAFSLYQYLFEPYPLLEKMTSVLD
jgi:hypothetical protein